MPVAPIYHSPWSNQQPGWDTILLYPSKISMIVANYCQPTLLIVPILTLYFYTYASRGHPQKHTMASRPCQLIHDPRYNSTEETYYHQGLYVSKVFHK